MIRIATERGYNGGFSRQVVFEWEDDFAYEFKTPMLFLDSYKKHPLGRLFRKLKVKKCIGWRRNHDVNIYIATNIDLLRITAWYQNNVIPILLDVSLEEITELAYITKNLPVYYVTSYRIYEEMKKIYAYSNVKYIPQSIAYKYINNENEEKNIDFIQFGRCDKALHRYAIDYCRNHNGISYVYRGETGEMKKFQSGEEKTLGPIEQRSDFIDLLSKSRISLCSTPMASKSRDFGENIDFFTARWYESVACNCWIIGNWSNYVNEEILITRINTVAEKVEDYKQFEAVADWMLNTPYKNDAKEGFLQINNSRTRALTVVNDLHKLGYR